MRTQRIIAFTAAILAVSAPAIAATNLIKDGGFETPPTPPGSYNKYGLGETFGPWTVTGAEGGVATVASGFMQSGFTFKAKKGKAWLDLTGVSDTATGVAQTVQTNPGATYTLTFWVGNIYDPTGIFGTTSTVDVYDGTALLLRAVNVKKSKTHSQVWQAFTVNFTATASKTTLSFINADPSNDTNNGLDDVSVAPAGTHAPLASGLSR